MTLFSFFALTYLACALLVGGFWTYNLFFTDRCIARSEGATTDGCDRFALAMCYLLWPLAIGLFSFFYVADELIPRVAYATKYGSYPRPFARSTQRLLPRSRRERITLHV